MGERYALGRVSSSHRLVGSNDIICFARVPLDGAFRSIGIRFRRKHPIGSDSVLDEVVDLLDLVVVVDRRRDAVVGFCVFVHLFVGLCFRLSLRLRLRFRR